MPDMVPVKSKNIHAIGFDPETGDMHVSFKSGVTYIHSNVPPDLHDAFLKAESIGSHYHQNFRGNENYPHRKLEGQSK